MYMLVLPSLAAEQLARGIGSTLAKFGTLGFVVAFSINLMQSVVFNIVLVDCVQELSFDPVVTAQNVYAAVEKHTPEGVHERHRLILRLQLPPLFTFDVIAK